MQRLMPDPRYNYRNIADAFSKIVKYEGIRQTVRYVYLVCIILLVKMHVLRLLHSSATTNFTCCSIYVAALL